MRYGLILGLGISWWLPALATADGILIDHNDTDITALSQSAMQRAKDKLNIAYGHTSHGSQLTTGMNGLVGFANDGGLGLSLPTDFFDWNNGGDGGELDLHDYAMGGDVGYWPQWVNNTTSYLNNPTNAGTNVIIWSWCGQVDDKYSAGTLGSEYLTPMSNLETTYQDVTFVYMTGHVDIWDDADNKAANQMIRDYCATNDKVLYDFADIEHYDPNGTYFEFVNDNCDYYDSAGGTKLGNWATEWQDSHTEGVDWYDCSSAHSEPLNANRKAYAAWALWTEIAASMTALDADFDNDGDVDEQDLSDWQYAFGNNTSGDADGDGDSDGRDFLIWQTQYEGPSGGSAIAVPEPASWILLLAIATLDRLIRRPYKPNH